MRVRRRRRTADPNWRLLHQHRRAHDELGVWGATEQKTGLSAGC
jgi:hypothetical protein